MFPHVAGSRVKFYVLGVVESFPPVDIRRWHRKVFCVGLDEKLGFGTMADIMASGYSRVLVYDGDDTRNIRGYLQVSNLLKVDSFGTGYSRRASRRSSSVQDVLDAAGLGCPFSRAWHASFSTLFVGADSAGCMGFLYGVGVRSPGVQCDVLGGMVERLGSDDV